LGRHRRSLVGSSAPTSGKSHTNDKYVFLWLFEALLAGLYS